MAKSMGEKIEDVGSAAVDATKRAGSSIASGVERGVEFIKEKTGLGEDATDRGIGAMQEGMDVIASCGKKVGVVDRVEGQAIKLTRKDSPDQQHHFIPVSWVARVDKHVHLTKNSAVTEAEWKSNVTGCV